MLEICCTFKNESGNLLEWIAYHHLIGVDKIVMYNDKSTDNFMDEIAIVPNNFIEIRPSVERKNYSSRQIEIYNSYVKACQIDKIPRWSIFLDIDEYLMMPFAKTILDLIPCDISQIRLNWLMFGSNNQQVREQGLIIERFTECDLSHHKGRICKSLFRPERVHYADVHFSQVKGKTVSADFDFVCRGDSFFSPKIHSNIYIAHYAIKSVEEFNSKVARGYNTANPDVPPNYFNDSNAKGTIVNDLAKFAPFVKMVIEDWRCKYVSRIR